MKLHAIPILMLLGTLPTLLFGTEAPTSSPALLQQAYEYYDQYQYGMAKRAAEERLADVEPDSVQAAEALELLVKSWLKSSEPRSPEMLDLIREAIAIREQHQGPELALGLCTLADVHRDRVEIAEALDARQRALDLQESQLGPDHPDVADTLLSLAGDLRGVGLSGDAVDGLERALRIRDTTFGADSHHVAEVLERLCMTRPMADAANIPDIERALRIREAVHGPDHVEVASSLDILAVHLYRRGEFDEARPLFERALRLWEETFGPDDHRVARGLVGYGVMVHIMGDTSGARDAYERALRIRERIWGPDHLLASQVVNNLAVASMETGNYHRAEEMFQRALKVYRRRLGNEQIIGRTLNNLAGVYEDQGDLHRARATHEEALALLEKTDASDDFRARSMENLGRVMTGLAEYQLAGRHLERALEMQRGTWGDDHLEVAMCRKDYGAFLKATGKHAEAVRELETAVRIFRANVDSGYRLYHALVELADAYRANGQVSESIQTALEAETIAREQFRRTCRVFSETEALNYAKARVSGLDVALGILDRDGGGSISASVPAVFDQVIRSRALVLDEMASRHRGFLGQSSPELDGLAQKLEQAWKELAELAVKRYSGESPDEFETELQRAQASATDAERELAKASVAFRQRADRFEIGLREVVEALPDNGALVAYTHFEGGLLAFVIPPRKAEPTAVRLGSAEGIEKLVERWRHELRGIAIWPDQAERAEARYREVGLELRRAIWDPIEAEIAGADLVLIVPDGAVHHVSVAALPADEDGRYLVETEPPIHYLSTERDVVRECTARRAKSSGLFAVGGPDFDTSVVAAAGATVQEKTTSVVRIASTRASCEDLRNRRFGSLPGARREAEAIASLWKEATGGRPDEVVLLVDENADEATFKRRVPGNRVIHIATHGFFASDDCASLLHRSTAATDSSKTSSIRESPLLHAGLALAGANNRERMDRGAGVEDGMLTAQEVASLDLSTAEWVVLSGCETGLGRTQVGEGVLGLRRAFEIAGAGTLIMSLWQVDDLATRDWMRQLYSARLQGLSTVESMQVAAKKRLEALRKDGRSTHPASWGAFVASGDWR